MGIIFSSIPIHSVMAIPPERRRDYLVAGMQTSKAVRRMLIAPRTGAYLRGLAKTHQLPEKNAVAIAFVVLQVATGEVPMAKIGGLLSSHLKLSNERAQAIAEELERDLLAPLSLDISAHKQSTETAKANEAGDNATDAGASNVLNLKRTTPPEQQ